VKICPACETRFSSPDWTCPSCAWSAGTHGSIRSVVAADGAEGFSAHFFDGLAGVEDRHFWFRARNALIAWALARYFPDAQTFLEAGCGTGQVVRSLQRARPGLRITASEAFLDGLTMAARRSAGIELVQADVRRLPWENAFDAVGAFDVIEHIVEDQEAVRQLARAVVPGGGVIVTVPQHGWLHGPVDEYSGHVRRYSRRELVGVLENAGLRVERVTSFVSVLLPALILSRALRRRRPVDPMEEYRLSPIVNTIGGVASAVDRVCIRAGLSLPAGGSLLAVARRPV
jgi:SAM-dependent methyltransferase